MSIEYVPPFANLRKALRISADELSVTMSKELFTTLIAALADAAGFDPVWYRATYPDAASATDRGEYADELEHFAAVGYQEGWLHRKLSVDQDWYRGNYPDIDDALRESGDFDTQDHFEEFGYAEGRANSAAVEVEAEKWAEVIARSAALVHGRVHVTGS